MDNLFFKKLCDRCDKLLLKYINDNRIFSNGFLHIIRFHPVFIERYKESFKNFIYLIVKNFLYFVISVIKSLIVNKSKFENIKPKNIIFISHLVTKDQLSGYNDFYYGKMIRIENSYTIFINHVFSKINLNPKLKCGPNKLIFKETLSFFEEVKLFFLVFKSAFKIFFNEKKDLFTLLLCLEMFTPQTINNLRIRNQIVKIVRRVKPKLIILICEGHAWERAVIEGVKSVDISIKCFGYQHAAIFKTQYSLFKKFDANYNYDGFLTSGEHPKERLLKAFPKAFVKIIGSPKIISKIKHLHLKENNCLVIPEGLYKECDTLFNFSLKCAIINPDINFVWRLHPIIPDKYFSKNIFKNLPKNIIISKNSLEYDSKYSQCALFRGSTAIFELIRNNVKPIYLDHGKLDINPLYFLNNQINYISEPKEFKNIFRRPFNKDLPEIIKVFSQPLDYKEFESAVEEQMNGSF